MSLGGFVIMWILAVVGMTLFSAAWTVVSGNEFREPKRLSILMQRARGKSSGNNSNVWGWIIHFLLGIPFLGFYEVLWKLTAAPRTVVWSVVFGCALGVLGVLGWMLLFKIVGVSTQFKYRQFYVHIFFAHIVFSVTALLVYTLLL